MPQNQRFLGSRVFSPSQESSKLREIQFQMVQMDGLDQGICLTTYIQSENHDTCSIWPKGAHNMSFLPQSLVVWNSTFPKYCSVQSQHKIAASSSVVVQEKQINLGQACHSNIYLGCPLCGGVLCQNTAVCDPHRTLPWVAPL